MEWDMIVQLLRIAYFHCPDLLVHRRHVHWEKGLARLSMLLFSGLIYPVQAAQ
jgi:hypothetical protein